MTVSAQFTKSIEEKLKRLDGFIVELRKQVVEIAEKQKQTEKKLEDISLKLETFKVSSVYNKRRV